MSEAPLNASRSILARWVIWMEDNVWLFAFVAAAFVIRYHWNTELHPPEDYIYSDMRGYIRRADGVFVDLEPARPNAEVPPWYFPFAPREYNGFYPYGTHVLLFLLQWPVGKGNFGLAADAYAVFGAVLVGYGYALARRVSNNRYVPILAGVLLVCYYPYISLGGYFLSEVPFALCLTAATFHLMRLIDDGRRRDAWFIGIFVALGATLRPQILLSAALIGVFWLIRRKAMSRVTIWHWLQAGVPILLMLAFSSWRLHYHTERVGLISENGTFNRVFGRCHNEKITASPDSPKRRRTSFGPPPLIQLAKRAQTARGEWPQLDPALETHFEYRGYIGDSEILNGFIDRCVEKTGLAKQIEYSAVNVAMQWRYNVMWPDSGKRDWQPYSRKWGFVVANGLAIPALLCMLAVFLPRRFLKLAVVSLHLWALTGVGIFYLGGQRFRSPYDAAIIVLALEAYAVAIAFGWGLIQKFAGKAPPEPTTSDAPKDA